MRLALLGDIHGNHLALAAVLTAARALGVQRLLNTGDMVGYYFWPREVMELLAPWDMVVARGNHEEMLAEARKRPQTLEKIDQTFGTGLRVALETLSRAQLAWLESLDPPLELEIEGHRMLLCHGSPWDVDQYVYPDADDALLERCADPKYEWVILGHTHYPMERTIGNTTIVNPGSVGQPRNRVPGAHWALLDTQSRQVTFRVEPYDRAPVVEYSRAHQPGLPYLADVLDRTR